MSTKIRGRERKQWPVPPEGLYPAVCADAWDIWTEQRPERFGGGLIDKTRLVWVLDKTDRDGTPFQVSQGYTASLHEKANLRKMLESWRGKKFTEAEQKEFELEAVVGAPCQVQVIHNVSNEGITYANVQAVVPLGKGMTKPRIPDGFVRKRDRDKQNERDTQGGGQPGHDDDVPF